MIQSKNLKENVKENVDRLKEKLADIREGLPKHWVLNRIIIFLGVIFLIIEGLLKLDEFGVLALPPQLLQIGAGIILVVLALLIASTFIRITEGWVFRLFGKESEIEQILFFKKLYGVVVYFFAIAFILIKFGVSLGNITLFAGLVASGVAMALREVLISYMVWFMLLTKHPFRIGDYIKIGPNEGKVLHIGTFYVILDSDEELDDQIVRVPNKIFLEQPLENYGRDGMYVATAKVSYKGVPDDLQQRVRQAEETVKELTSGRGTIYLDSQGEYVSIVAKYPVRYTERDEMRKKIILAIGAHDVAVKRESTT